MGCVYVPNWFSGICKIFAIILFIIIITFLITIYSLKHIVRDNWAQYRCDPFIMPFSGFFGYDPVKNFNNCIRLNVNESSKPLLSPFEDVFAKTTETMNAISGGITDATDVLNVGRTGMSFGLTDIMGKMGNVATTTEFLMIKIKTIFQKILALYVTLLYAGWSLMKGMEGVVKDPNIKKMSNLLDKAANL